MPITIKSTGINQATIRTLNKFASRYTLEPNGCWEWQGYKELNGYGIFGVLGRARFAHRIMWEAIGNPVDFTKQLDHLCSNRACVNPKHLEQVDAKTNTLRSNAPTAQNARKTHCKRGHLLLGDNTYIQKRYRAGQSFERCCRKCDSINMREYRARLKATLTKDQGEK